MAHIRNFDIGNSAARRNTLEKGYSTISLGYIGLYEMTKLMKDVSHTTPEGEEFALRVMKYQ